MTQTRSLLRRMFDAMIEARTREANRRVAMYTATFTPEDIWEDLSAGRRDQPAARTVPHGTAVAAH